MKKSSLVNTTFAAAVLGTLVLVNVLGLRLFKRFDWSKDNAYTLSETTKSTLSGLEENVSITAYFSEKLPAPYSDNARYVRDLLDEYRAQSHGKVNYAFVDPQAEGEKEGKREVKRDFFGRAYHEPTQIEKDLVGQGVQPVEIRVIEEDQQQTKKAYMGLVIKHLEKKEVIGVVQRVDTLEYELTSLIRKLTRTKMPVVGFLQGHDEPKAEEKLKELGGVLGQMYQVRQVDLTGKDKIDDDVEALMVIGPKTALAPNELKAIDQFLMQGKSAGFFLDAVRVDTRTFESTPAEHGLTALLASYGVKVGDQVIGDGQSFANLTVQERRGSMVINMPVPYPFIPVVPALENGSPISKGLGGVAFGFPTEVTATAADGRAVEVLARTTAKSWLEPKPFNLDPRRDWRSQPPTADGTHSLAVQVSGKLKSHFATEASQSAASGAAPLLAESKADVRLVVAGGSSFLQDDFLQRGNLVLASNIVDWLALDPALLAMRGRGMASAPLQPELSSATRNVARVGNALGVPVVLVAFGLVRYFRRERRRSQVKAAEA